MSNGTVFARLKKKTLTESPEAGTCSPLKISVNNTID